MQLSLPSEWLLNWMLGPAHLRFRESTRWRWGVDKTGVMNDAIIFTCGSPAASAYVDTWLARSFTLLEHLI
jgi:hypothetical protein